MLPATITQGDTVQFAVGFPPAGTTELQVYFRTNQAGAGLTVAGLELADGQWGGTITSAETGGLSPGTWAWQAVATTDPGSFTVVQAGRLEVLASLAYTGTPGAIDSRSQAEKDLEAVEAAIRQLQSGAQSYTIQNRTFTRVQLGSLIAWRDRLLQAVAAERRAAGEGRRDRRILVRFE